MARRNNYSKYSDETQSFMKEIEESLKQRNNGKFDSSWNLNLKLLADNVELYNECQKIVEEEGIFNRTSKTKNPLLSTLKDSSAMILKFLQQNGLTIWSASKIKTPETDDTEDFLDNLIN